MKEEKGGGGPERGLGEDRGEEEKKEGREEEQERKAGTGRSRIRSPLPVLL